MASDSVCDHAVLFTFMSQLIISYIIYYNLKTLIFSHHQAKWVGRSDGGDVNIVDHDDDWWISRVYDVPDVVHSVLNILNNTCEVGSIMSLSYRWGNWQ